MENQTEQWKDIEGYEGLYQVSNEGRVKSLNYRQTKQEKILKAFKNNNGYLLVGLCKNGKPTHKLVHRLVAEAFIPMVEGKQEIDHINSVRHDNRVENLRWCTSEENAKNPITLEKVKAANRKKAEALSKKVFCYDTNFNFLSGFSSTADTARQLKLSQGNVTLTCLGALKHYKGYIFSYIPNLTKEAYEETLEQGKEKAINRLKSVNKACGKWQRKNRDRVCAYQREYYRKRKEKMNE
jgi:hypothetical protein